MTEALKLVRKKLVNVMAELASFAENATRTCPPWPSPISSRPSPPPWAKRATLWLMELLLDLDDLDYVIWPP